MRPFAFITVPLAVLAVVVFVTLHHDGPRLLMEGGPLAHLAVGLTTLLVLSAAALAFVAQGDQAWLAYLAVAMTPLPWLFGVLGLSVSMLKVEAAMTVVAPEMRGVLGAVGFSEAMSPVLVGCAGTLGVALGLSIALGVRAAEAPLRAGAAVALAVAFAAGAAALRAAHQHELFGALAHVDPEQRAALAREVGAALLPRGALAFAALSVAAAAGALAALRPGRRAGALGWIAVGAAALLLASGWAVEQSHRGLVAPVLHERAP